MWPTALFIALVSGLVVFLYMGLRRFTQHASLGGALIIIWVLATGVLSAIGIFSTFNTLPPPIVLAIAPMVALIAYSAVSPRLLTLVDAVPLTWLTHVHVFRVVMEVILWALAAQHIVPEVMTWHGRNMDIVIGVTAPLVGMFCLNGQSWGRRVAILWNGLGIALLVNVFLHGLLSAPTPFQVFVTQPANTFVGSFPYTWLPTFVLPCAVLFHVLSIRKLKKMPTT